MGNKIGIYEFFAYTVPGGLYILVGVYALHLFEIVPIKPSYFSLSAVNFFFFVAFSYVFGHIFNRICDVIWYRFFRVNHFETMLAKFRNIYPNMEFNFSPIDWPILLACLRRENLQIVSEIEKFNAAAILFKNISFAFLILSIAQIVQLAFFEVSSVHFILLIFFVISSIISMDRSLVYNKWFSATIYEAIIARSININDLIDSK
jgi:hypothetical protein